MKKGLFKILLLSFILISCNQNESNNHKNNKENQELKDEIIKMESISENIEEIQLEIDSASIELDNLLNDL